VVLITLRAIVMSMRVYLAPSTLRITVSLTGSDSSTIASPGGPCAQDLGWERSNLNRPLLDRFTAAATSLSITIRQLLHQSLRLNHLSVWSLSPHLGQATLEPLVSRLLRRIMGKPDIWPHTRSVAEPLRNSSCSLYPHTFYPDHSPSGRGSVCR